MNKAPGKANTENSSSPKFLDTGAEILSIVTSADGQEVATRSSNQQFTPDRDFALTAGLIDLQVNGFSGIDFNSDSINADDVDQALGAMLATGVTTCLPTIITASKSLLQSRLSALDKAVSESRLGPRMVPGYHLEGPFLNPEPGYAGCHPPQDMLLPSIDLFRKLEQNLARPILYLTLAPELENARELISWAAGRHKIVGVGHSAVNREELSDAVDAGLQVSTHLGNGVAAILPKFDNPVLWQLSEDRLVGCFIADGIHIPAEILKSFIRAKGIERTVLVTDAIAAAGAPAGSYSLAGMAVESNDDGVVKLQDSPLLAGSSLRMDLAVANITKWGIADFRSALRMACANPLALLKPALKAHEISISLGEIAWGADCHPQSVSLGSCKGQGF